MDIFFFFSSRRRHTRYWRDWSSDVCSSDLASYLVIGFTNCVITCFSDNMILSRLCHIDKLCMPTGNQEGHKRVCQLSLLAGRHQVTCHMIDWNQGQIISPSKGLGCC